MKDPERDFYAALAQVDQQTAAAEEAARALSERRQALRDNWRELARLRALELERKLQEKDLGICRGYHRYANDEGTLEGMGVFPRADMVIQYNSGATKETVGYDAYVEGWYQQMILLCPEHANGYSNYAGLTPERRMPAISSKVVLTEGRLIRVVDAADVTGIEVLEGNRAKQLYDLFEIPNIPTEPKFS